MLIRSAFRYLLFFLFLTSCDDLPEGNPQKTTLASVGSLSEEEQPVLSRPSPPLVMEDTLDEKLVTVHYGAPSVRGRTIYGELVPYGEIWRTGANEATVLSIQDSFTVAGQSLAPGQYALFTIPSKNEWTVILNADYDQWGAYNYDESKDVARFSIVPDFVDELQEQMRFVVQGNNLVLQWEYMRLSIPFAAKAL